jgi:hypothetical protein
MRRILICTGVLGGGTALTFAAAALAATLLPGGTIVPASNVFFQRGVMVNGGMIVQGGSGMAVPVPMPAPVNPSDVITVPPTPGP